MQAFVDKFLLLFYIPVWYMRIPRRHCYLFSVGQAAARRIDLQLPAASCPSCLLLIVGFDNALKTRRGTRDSYCDGSKNECDQEPVSPRREQGRISCRSWSACTSQHRPTPQSLKLYAYFNHFFYREPFMMIERRRNSCILLIQLMEVRIYVIDRAPSHAIYSDISQQF